MKDLKDYIRKLSHDFSLETLSELDVEANPLLQFEKWFRQAIEAKVNAPNAMVVSTASKEGKPSGRVLLLRNFDETGFVFYTNYNSRKSSDLRQNAFAALTFFWPELERQVRIEGQIVMQSPSESDNYFEQRPVGSQLGAWASPQSEEVSNRSELEKKYAKVQERFSKHPMYRPPHWGGFILKPELFEFWQGRPGRMHDRIIFKLNEFNVWQIVRLAP